MTSNCKLGGRIFVSWVAAYFIPLPKTVPGDWWMDGWMPEWVPGLLTLKSALLAVHVETFCCLLLMKGPPDVGNTSASSLLNSLPIGSFLCGFMKVICVLVSGTKEAAMWLSFDSHVLCVEVFSHWGFVQHLESWNMESDVPTRHPYGSWQYLLRSLAGIGWLCAREIIYGSRYCSCFSLSHHQSIQVPALCQNLCKLL